jgi:MoaA/NifB/PqqE/SkfB family radical SAM enzyme
VIGRAPNRLRKYARLAAGIARGVLFHQAPFLRVIPTDRCDLRCRYCFQHDPDSPEMGFAEFGAILDHGLSLGTGVVSFLGGEPLLWPHLDAAIGLCASRHVLTDLTTNGRKLTAARIAELAAAGLDLLNVSVDTDSANEVSVKNRIFADDVLAALAAARERTGLRTRVNTVAYRDNSAAVKQIVARCQASGLAVSVGYVVPHVRDGVAQNAPFLFTLDDRPLLADLISWLVARRREGWAIIDPPAYYRNVFRFLRGERFWLCNYPRRLGWINVTPRGLLRTCTKKMDELPPRFVDLTPAGLRAWRRGLLPRVRECNRHCYSNCAYDGAYFRRHLPELLGRFLRARRPAPADLPGSAGA